MKKYLVCRFYILVFFTMGISTLYGCGNPSTTVSALNTLSAFLKALDHIHEISESYQENVQLTVESLESKFEKDGKRPFFVFPRYEIDLPETALAWEREWNEVTEETTRLEDTINELTPISEKYFKELNSISEGITDPAIRKSEQDKNKRVKSEWDGIYKETIEHLERAKKVEMKGHDFQRVLIASALRSEIGKHIRTLESIRNEAQSLANELQALTKKAKSLAESPSIET